MEDGALVNFNNYFVYANMIRQKTEFTINVPKDLDLNNIEDHIQAIFNILKDGIETDYIHQCKIKLEWENGISCRLNIIDYWLSLFMWSMIFKCGHPIRPCHIFLGTKVEKPLEMNGLYVPWELKRKDIERYINTHILTLENKIRIGNEQLNIIISDTLWKFSLFEHFSYYLANTINNEDDIALMQACPEYDKLKHTSLLGVPIEQVKDEGMKITYKVIDFIKDSEKYLGYEHGLTNSFRANEAINPRQFKEACINIGTKPTSSGNIFPYIIDKNFSSGGVNDALSYYIESSTARTAQILSKINVGSSGELARILGLNNTDTVLHPNPAVECNSQHYIRYMVKSKKHLSMIKGRYFRFDPRGMEYLVDMNDSSLIGQTIYLHSPMTCATHSIGKGICRRCYGILYWTNRDINVGKMAAELLSSKLTQRLLSAKHLLEAIINSIKWNPEFKDYFTVDVISIKLSDELPDDDILKRFFVVIDPEQIQLVNDEEDAVGGDYSSEKDEDESSDDDSEGFSSFDSGEEEYLGSYNEYVTSFTVQTPDGREVPITSEEQTELYLSHYLTTQMEKRGKPLPDGRIAIPFDQLMDDTIFYITINNNEISKTMNDIINIINKASVTEKLTKDEALQNLVDLIVTGDLDIDSVHLEVILSNQIVDAENPLVKPNWAQASPKYKMTTLNTALANNPSVIISLLYNNLHKTLYNPLTYMKKKASMFDLFFCESPQNYMNDEILTDDTSQIRDLESKVKMYSVVNKSPDEEVFFKKHISEEAMAEYQEAEEVNDAKSDQ